MCIFAKEALARRAQAKSYKKKVAGRAFLAHYLISLEGLMQILRYVMYSFDGSD